MMSGRIPVTLLTGFLGSGKTSLLRRVIHQPGFAQCAVIINEFGEVGLDQALVADASDDRDIQLLDSGCLCCLASSAIQDTLASLYYRRLRGEIPWFDRVLIETSGLAEPGPIINAVYGDDSINRHFVFAGIVTTFDAGFGQEDSDRYAEAKQQLMMADTIVLTKGDTQDAQQVDDMMQWLAHMHPSARLLDNRMPDQELADVLLAPAANAGPVCADLRQASDVGTLRMPGPLRHLMRYGIHSVVIDVPQDVSWPAWAAFVRHAQRTLADRLLRLKGVLVFAGQGPMVVHAVHHLFSMPERARHVPEGLRGKLVFIVRDMSRDEIVQVTKHFEPFEEK